jgi:hypothetical protein
MLILRTKQHQLFAPEPFKDLPIQRQPQHELVVANASIEDLPKAKLKVDDPKGMPHVGAKGGFRRLNQIQKPSSAFHR